MVEMTVYHTSQFYCYPSFPLKSDVVMEYISELGVVPVPTDMYYVPSPHVM